MEMSLLSFLADELMDLGQRIHPLLPQHPALIQNNVTSSRTIFVSDNCPREMLRTTVWSVQDFELTKQLYRGKASTLYIATCRQSEQLVVIKAYSKRRLSRLNWYQVDREIRLHSNFKHENIISLYAAFEDRDHVFLVQEYASGGDLYEDLRRSGGKYKEFQVAKDIMPQFLSALLYLHRNKIIHRDIKPENILLTKSRTIKMADFGLSINWAEERPVTRAGTLDYMSPEVLRCPEKSLPEENKEKVLLGYTDAVDCWAVGILAFELLTGHPPFEKDSRDETYHLIMHEDPKFPPWMSDAAKDFITAALAKTARKRPRIKDLLIHPWIAQYGRHDAHPKGHASLQLSLKDFTARNEQHRSSIHGALSVRNLEEFASSHVIRNNNWQDQDTLRETSSHTERSPLSQPATPALLKQQPCSPDTVYPDIPASSPAEDESHSRSIHQSAENCISGERKGCADNFSVEDTLHECTVLTNTESYQGAFMELYRSLAVDVTSPAVNSPAVLPSASVVHARSRPASSKNTTKHVDSILPPLPGSASTSPRSANQRPNHHSEMLPALVSAESKVQHAAVNEPDVSTLGVSAQPLQPNRSPPVMQTSTDHAGNDGPMQCTSECPSTGANTLVNVPQQPASFNLIAAEPSRILSSAEGDLSLQEALSPSGGNTIDLAESNACCARSEALSFAPKASSALKIPARNHSRESSAVERMRGAERKHIEKMKARIGAAQSRDSSLDTQCQAQSRRSGSQPVSPKRKQQPHLDQHNEARSIPSTATSLLQKLMGKRAVRHEKQVLQVKARARPQSAAVRSSKGADGSQMTIVRAKSDASTVLKTCSALSGRPQQIGQSRVKAASRVDKAHSTSYGYGTSVVRSRDAALPIMQVFTARDQQKTVGASPKSQATRQRDPPEQQQTLQANETAQISFKDSPDEEHGPNAYSPRFTSAAGTKDHQLLAQTANGKASVALIQQDHQAGLGGVQDGSCNSKSHVQNAGNEDEGLIRAHRTSERFLFLQQSSNTDGASLAHDSLSRSRISPSDASMTSPGPKSACKFARPDYGGCRWAGKTPLSPSLDNKGLKTRTCCSARSLARQAKNASSPGETTEAPDEDRLQPDIRDGVQRSSVSWSVSSPSAKKPNAAALAARNARLSMYLKRTGS